MRGWPDLEALDKALTALKYQTNTTKTSEAFTRRQQAIQGLRHEIATHRQWADDVFELTHDPKVVALLGVGFVESYLNELDPGDLDLLHQAHLALSVGLLPQAQDIFDQLNPPQPAIPTVGLQHWTPEPYATMKQTGGGNFYDFRRTRDDTMAAQRQLLAYHARAIDGDYGELFRYKPYKHHALTDLSGAAHLNAQSLRSWNTVEQGGYPGLAPTLAQTAPRAQEIAEQSTQASQARGKNNQRRHSSHRMRSPHCACTPRMTTAR